METKKEKISGFVPVFAAIFGNFLITCIKFIGYFISGSGALFSEAIHSFADVSNQVLLMVGIKRSVKQADEEFTYGYGRERFFWALISACSIFFLGAGVTISHGIQSLTNGETVHISPVIFIILAVSLLVDLTTLILAVKELKSSGKNLAESLKGGDPSTIAVLYEDSVAVLGVLIALGSVLLTKFTGKLYWDAWGSISIGILLAIVAVLLIKRNRTYLIGRSMPSDLEEKIIELLEADPTIEKVLDFKSTALDFNKYRIKCEVEFNSSVLLKKIFKSGFKSEYDYVKEDYENFLKFCVEHTDRIPRLVGSKIDELEKKIQEEIPCVTHIDIEIN